MVGEPIQNIYFLYNGIVAYVLEKFDDCVYAIGTNGDLIGLLDLFPPKQEGRRTLGSKEPKRKFTLQCISGTSELLSLRLSEFDHI